MTSRMPGRAFRRDEVRAGEFVLDYAEAGPDKPKATLVSLPGSAGLEMSIAKDRLSRWFRVVEINPPGWGGKGDLNRPMTSAECAAILGEAALRLTRANFFLLGTSAGGSNALQLAARNPAKVKGVILEGSMAPSQRRDRRGRMTCSQHPRTPAPDLVNYPLSIDPKAYPVPSPDPRKPWATEEYIAQQMQNRFAWFQWMRTDYFPADALEGITSSGIPVLALLGADDELLRPTQERTIRNVLPHADFHLIPRGLHDLQNSEPAAMVALVRQFIETLQGGSPT